MQHYCVFNHFYRSSCLFWYSNGKNQGICFLSLMHEFVMLFSEFSFLSYLFSVLCFSVVLYWFFTDWLLILQQKMPSGSVFIHIQNSVTLRDDVLYCTAPEHYPSRLWGRIPGMDMLSRPSPLTQTALTNKSLSKVSLDSSSLLDCGLLHSSNRSHCR